MPTDFSKPSKDALSYAVRFARESGATIHLLHVLPGFPRDIEGFPLLRHEADQVARVRGKLLSLADEEIEELVPVKIDVTVGKPFREIVDFARKAGADLIIMPTQGRTGFNRILLGSTAELVVRYAPCPVLIVRESEREAPPTEILMITKPIPEDGIPEDGQTRGRPSAGTSWSPSLSVTPFSAPMFRLNKILVPVDFPLCSKDALAYAAQFCAHKGGHVTLLNVMKPRSRGERRRKTGQKEASRLDDAEQKLLELGERELATVSACDFLVQIGTPHREIVNVANALAVDLIVMPTRGRTGPKHAVRGRTAELIIRHAPCPVLVVPEHRQLPERVVASESRGSEYEIERGHYKCSQTE